MKYLLLVVLFSIFSAPLLAEEICTDWKSEKLGKIDIKKLDESSGIVVSRQMANVFWTHNDSSDKARLFAIDKKGKKLGEFDIEDADAIDWEDISIAPCSILPSQSTEDGDCLFIGDIGNNTTQRDTFTIYVVREPLRQGSDKFEEDTLSILQRIDFEYEKKPRNSEAFFVNHDGVWLFDKGGASDLYHLKFDSDQARHMGKQKKIEFLTGADLNESGTAFILRSNNDAWIFSVDAEESIADAFERKGVKIDIKAEPHGEGIAWYGEDFVTSSEGRYSRLRKYRCKNSFGKADGVDNTTDRELNVSGGGCSHHRGKGPLPLIFLLFLAGIIARRKRVNA